MTRLLAWLDHRVGYKQLLDAMLLEHIPGGAKWRYVWGSCLTFVFSLQLVTGILMMFAYSPSDSTAWSSVYYIQYQMEFGWLIRGLHHFGSQTMVVLLAIHMLQVVIAGAHLPPREVNWWLGLGLLACVLGLSLTGYLLPWDQKGYWATQVATNIAGNIPVVGPIQQKLIVGGPSYGHHTLTRFFALHVAVLPGILIALLIAHIAVFRRHGITHPRNPKGEAYFWPDQVFKDLIACIAVLAVMLGLVIYGGHGNKLPQPAKANAWEAVTLAGQAGLGANLDAPADPSSAYPARPEWYFLFLFQLLKYFEGHLEIVGTVVIPCSTLLVLALLPLLGHGRMRPVGHFLSVIVVLALIGGAGWLTYQAIDDDTVDPLYKSVAEVGKDPEPNNDPTRAEKNAKARLFQQQRHEADALAQRAVELAAHGIPADGAGNLLRRDPKTRGPVLFGQYCAGCHNHGSTFSRGNKAADLNNWGSSEWILGLLKKAGDKLYFGHTKLTDMANWSTDDLPTLLKEIGPDGSKKLEQLADFLATAPKETGTAPEHAEGVKLLTETFKCLDCHRFGSHEGDAPDLAGYGSANWLREMLMAGDHARKYGEKNAMPIFIDLAGPEAGLVQDLNKDRKNLQHLSDVDRELIIRWMTRDPRLVFGGSSIADQPR